MLSHWGVVLRRLVALVLLALVLSLCRVPGQPQVVRIVGSGWVYAPAVTRVEGGFKGVLVNISLTVLEGDGEVYVSTVPLTELDMQATALIAARTACRLLGLDFSRYTFLFRIEADTVIVGGPSAGAVMTVLAYSVLSGTPINRSVMMTGMINPDGTVGIVGGVLEKAEAAARAGAKLFLVPPGETSIVTYRIVERKVGPFIIRYPRAVTVNLTEYAANKWGLTVREIGDIRDAIEAMLGVKLEREEVAASETFRKALSSLLPAVAELEEKAAEAIASAYSSLRKAKGFARALASTRLARANSTLYSLPEDPALALTTLIRVIEEAETAKLVGLSWNSKLLEDAVREDVKYVEDVYRTLNSTAKLLPLRYATLASVELGRAREAWEASPGTAIEHVARAFAYAKAAEALSRIREPELSGVDPLDALSEARAVFSYAEAVVSTRTGLLSDAARYYEEAKKRLIKGETLPAYVLAIESSVLSECAIALEQALLSAAASKAILDNVRSRALADASSRGDSAALALFLRLAETTSAFEDSYLYYRLTTYYSRALGATPSTPSVSTTTNATAKPAPPVSAPPTKAPTGLPKLGEPENLLALAVLAVFVLLIAALVKKR